MMSALRKALERRGLPEGADERTAQDFYARLSLEEKGKIGEELGREAFGAGPEQPLPSGEPLTVREVSEDLTVRTFSINPDTINEEERSIEGVFVSEAPVTVYDWRTGDMIDEVLLIDGGRHGDRITVLDNHNRWSTAAVLGSATNFRREADVGGGVAGKSARLTFVRDDPEVDRIWNKIRQRHLRDLSVGYGVNPERAVVVEPRQTAVIAGRSFTAMGRRLRVAQEWTAREISVTPIGADQLAKMRSQGQQAHNPQEFQIMNPRLRAYLESIGLRREATEADAKAFLAGLTTEQRAAADAASVEPPPVQTPPVAPATPPATQPAARAEQTPDAIRQQATTAERDRVRQITELAGADVPAELRQQAISEGWDVARASQQFLSAVRGQRQPGQNPPPAYTPSAYTGPAPSGPVDVRALAAGILMSTGCADVTTRSMHNGRRDPTDADRLTAQDAERGSRFRGMSMADLIRCAAFVDTGRVFLTTAEALDAIRAAPSGGTLAYIWTTSMYAKLLEGWEKVADTTAWCEAEDVPNFLTQDDISIAASARLDRHPRGGTAKHATLSDSREQYKISRYSKQFVVDEMDQIDDRLAAIMRMPTEMGEAAAETIPDLVYSLLLENAAMADTGELFNATAVTTAGGHANLTTAVLGATGLKAAILAMGAYRENDRVLNIKPRYLIVPSALQWTAKELLTSTAQAYTAAASAATPSLYYPINVIVGENLTLVVDDRIGASGCWDPEAATTRTGSATNWFLSSARRTVRKLFRLGTSRRPQMRSFVLTQGQWGIGWDVNFDAGAMVPDYRGLHKSTGAG